MTMAYNHYPTFFGELWRGLKPLCESRPFVEAFLNLRTEVETLTAEADASLSEVVEMCRLFQWLLPGLITNVASFRHQLEAV